MIRTEKEASSCVCPIISRPQDGGVSFCVSSRCMAWRWAFDASGWAIMNDGAQGGFCGLACKP
jgi:hypothetical protein